MRTILKIQNGRYAGISEMIANGISGFLIHEYIGLVHLEKFLGWLLNEIQQERYIMVAILKIQYGQHEGIFRFLMA